MFLLFLQPLWNLLVHVLFMIYHVMCHILCLCSVQVVMSEFQYRQKTTPTPLTQTCQISTQVCQNFMKIIHTLHQVTISTQIIFCEDLPSCSHVWAVGILMNKHQSKVRWYLATHVSTSSLQKPEEESTADSNSFENHPHSSPSNHFNKNNLL